VAQRLPHAPFERNNPLQTAPHATLEGCSEVRVPWGAHGCPEPHLCACGAASKGCL